MVKIIFEGRIFICKLIFKIFVAHLKTFGMENIMRSHFLEVFQNKVVCKKAVHKGWCKENSIHSMPELTICKII